jgi:NAD(P)-dependent dehydrogenase (short-subunit alcohol dehydrogenase family)
MQPADAIYPSLRDRVVFVTGGGAGIGESVVEHFAAQGARVTFVDLQKEPSEALVERVAARRHPRPRFIPRPQGHRRTAVAISQRATASIKASSMPATTIATGVDVSSATTPYGGQPQAQLPPPSVRPQMLMRGGAISISADHPAGR